MSNIRVTAENAADFLGAEVRFWYGCIAEGAQEEFAIVVDYETTRWGTQLIARLGNGSTKTISSFTDVGVGAYLVDTAEANPVNTNSPWYVQE